MDYFVITDRTAARAAWEADQVWNTNWQTNGNMNPADMKDMIERFPGKYVAYPAACCPDGYALDISTAPFNDIRVRQAVSLAIDRQAHNQLVWGGMGVMSTPAGPAVHPMTMDLDELLTIPGWRQPKDQDIAKARELLAAAGYPEGFKTTLITGNTLSDQDKGPVLSDQLRRALNIEVEQIVLERLAKEEARNAGGYDMMTWGSGAGVITPDQFLYKFYALDNPQGNPLNWKYEGEEDLLALIDAQSAELDPVKRKAIVREIELITMTKDSHFIVVFNRTFARLFNTEKVGGQNPTQSGYAETKAEQLWLLNP
jgi:peptide/nickel transport system substrate-binding protein